MARIEGDVLVYIPFLFLTTLFIGMKLDGVGSPATSAWSLILLPLLVFVPCIVFLYLLRTRPVWGAPRNIAEVNTFSVGDDEEDDDIESLEYSVRRSKGIPSDRQRAMYKLPPMIYAPDRTSIALSLLAWAYFTVIPWGLSFGDPSSPVVVVVYYILIGIVIVFMGLYLLETLYWLLYQEGLYSLNATISERARTIGSFVRDRVVEETTNRDEPSYLVASRNGNIILNGPNARVDIVNQQRYVSAVDALEKKQAVEKDARDKQLNGAFSIPEGAGAIVAPSGTIPDMDNFVSDGNLVYDGTIPVPSAPPGNVAYAAGSSDQERLYEKVIRRSNNLDKIRQTKLALTVSIIVAMSLLIVAFTTQDPYYFRLTFIVPGAIFLAAVVFIVIQRQLRARVWFIGLLIAATVYLLITLMLYHSTPHLTWLAALTPLMIFEWYVAFICYCSLLVPV